jgi:PAS domain-containing protein
MTPSFKRGIRTLLRVLRLSEGGNGGSGSEPGCRSRTADDVKDIDDMLEAFRGLVSQLSHDGEEMGEICARAERKAARYVLLSEAVIESVTAGILVLGKGDRVLLANASAKRILDIDESTDIVGMDLASLFKDGREFRYLAGRCLETGVNTSRKVREVVTLAGHRRRLGISTSGVLSGPSSVDAVVMVFAALSDEPAHVPETGGEDDNGGGDQAYLMGVLDSYDFISGVITGLGRIEEKSSKGVLTTSELREFSTGAMRTCETLLAFALAAGAGNSIPELVDINGLLESILARLGIGDGSRLTRRFSDDLPKIKTVRKMLDVGVGLLIGGCMTQSAEGIEIATSPFDGGLPGSVVLSIREKSPSKAIAGIPASLRGLTGSGDLERRAALFLLSKLPKECHNLQAKHIDGFFHFSMMVGPPIKKET